MTKFSLSIKNIIIFTSAINLSLALLEIIGGYLFSSKALIADALNSFSDVVGSIILLIGMKIASFPPDKEHPYGHGKAENVSSFIVALVIGFVGLKVAFSSMEIFLDGNIKPPGVLALLISFVSILFKESLYRYTKKKSKEYESHVLEVSAWDYRADAITTLAAFFGILLSLIGKNYNLKYLLYFDSLAGVAVAVYVVFIAYKLGHEAVIYILDKVLDEEKSLVYKDATLEVIGVLKVDELRARYHGHYFIIDIKISVDPDLTVLKGHSIGKSVKNRLLKFEKVSNVLVHINPFDTK